MSEIQNIIKMKDGREVDFGKRGKQKSAYTVVGEGLDRHVVTTFDIPNGDTYSIKVGFDHPLVMELIGYGIKQKVADSLANAEDPEDISIAVERVMNQLNEGKWSVRTSESAGIRGFADLYKAYMEAKGVTEDPNGVLKKRLLDADEATIKATRSNAYIKSILARIAAERAAAKASQLSRESAELETSDLPI